MSEFDWKKAIRLCHLCTQSYSAVLESCMKRLPSDAEKIDFLKALVRLMSNEYCLVYSDLCDTVLADEYEFTEEDASPRGAIEMLEFLSRPLDTPSAKFENFPVVEEGDLDRCIPTKHEMKMMSQMYPMPDVDGTEELFKRLDGNSK